MQGLNIVPVFLKSSTGKNWLNSVQLKINTFSVLHFYARCSGNDQAWRPRIKATLLPVDKNTISFLLTISGLYSFRGFCLKNNR